MYFTSGSDRAFEQLMQTRPGADHFDSGEAGAPEDCGTCRFYRPHWKYQFCVYEECPYRQLSGEKAPTFHKLLFVHAEDTNAGVLRAAMLQKGFDLILVSSIGEAKRRIFEDKEIELILCDLKLPDGTAMELFHTLRRVAGMFQMKNPPVRLLPFFILTENNDLATEYEYRHEGVNDYITAPVNIPELIRRVLFFVE